MSVYLNREQMRVVQRNERGVVVYRKRYRRGDEVDTSKMVDGHADRLLASGALVRSKDDLGQGRGPTDQSEGAAARVGAAADLGSTATSYPDEPVPVPEDQQGKTSDEDDSDVEDVDKYSEMDYATLQQEAKSRDLNAGGSADDLRARLREDDNDGDED